MIAVPGNLGDRRLRFHLVAKAIQHATIDDIKGLLRATEQWSDRCRLYVLLALNCGMYQSDIADLQQHQVNWSNGTITRQRSKRAGKADAQTVTYPLWPETMRLLKQERSADGEQVLLTERHKPLVSYTEQGRQYDVVQAAFSRVMKRAQVRMPFSVLRKTSAQLLSTHQVHRHVVQYFLAHAPKTIAERHYIKPTFEQMSAALSWLGEEYGLAV